MTKSRIFISLITLMSLTFPVYSLTWKEFLEALKTESFNFPENARNKQVSCWKEVYWEEYIEGNSDYQGYVNSHTKKIKINCPY